jgi:esterase/lipase superfamily enzyme
VTKTASRWYSARVEQEISLVRWGHWGQPVLVFPTAGGDAEEIERMHLVGAVSALIEAGRIKV